MLRSCQMSCQIGESRDCSVRNGSFAKWSFSTTTCSGVRKAWSTNISAVVRSRTSSSGSNKPSSLLTFRGQRQLRALVDRERAPAFFANAPRGLADLMGPQIHPTLHALRNALWKKSTRSVCCEVPENPLAVVGCWRSPSRPVFPDSPVTSMGQHHSNHARQQEGCRLSS